MIFENLKSIETMSLQERERSITESLRSACTHHRHRSNMMLNPLRLDHLNRLDTLDADVITLNLEDAIAPSRKHEALVNIALFLSHLNETNSRIVVRTNPIDRGGAEEIRTLLPLRPDAFRIPKVRTPQEIESALKLLNYETELHISLETKESFRDLEHWGGIDSRLRVANLGILDLLADLGLPQHLVTRGPGNPTAEAILSRFLLSARTAGLLPVSFMYQEYRNLEGFRRWCLREREMGFEAKACMGPTQVKIANELFGPDEEAIDRARTIVERFEAASENGVHGFLDEEYGFIDEPIYRDALNTLKSYS